MRMISIIFVISIASLGILSCNDGSQSMHDQDRETGVIALQMDWPDNESTSPRNQARALIDCTAMDVDRISAQVFSDTHQQLQTGGPWNCAEGSGTISNVPAGDNLIVRLRAFNFNGDEVYRGEVPNVSVQSDRTAHVGVSMENVVRRNISVVQDINTGSGSSFPHRFFELQNQLCFVALGKDSGFELYIADADGSSAQLLADIYPNDDFDITGVMAPTDFVELNGWLYFCANNGGGYRLWRTRGTATSTALIASDVDYYNPAELTVFNNKFFFAADSAESGRELWLFDESTEQVRQVADIYSGLADSNLRGA